MDENTIYDGLNTNERPEGIKPKRGRLILSNLSNEQKELIRNGAFTLGGILVGGSAMAMFSSGFKTSKDAIDSPAPPTQEDPEVAVIYTEACFANSVKDDMTFNEAFATARGEVGPGGFFEWHGNVYNTYYKNEWDSLSESEIQEYWSSVEAAAEYDSLQLTDRNDLAETQSSTSNWEEGNLNGNDADLSELSDENISQSKPTKPNIDEIQEEIQHGISKPVVGIQDLDKDNIPDAIAEDYDNDGYADVYGIDKDNDGAIDQLMIDTDGDYDLDIIIIDDDGDGIENDESQIMEEELEIDMGDFIIIDDEEIENDHEIEEDLPEMDDDANIDDLI